MVVETYYQYMVTSPSQGQGSLRMFPACFLWTVYKKIFLDELLEFLVASKGQASY